MKVCIGCGKQTSNAHLCGECTRLSAAFDVRPIRVADKTTSYRVMLTSDLFEIDAENADCRFVCTLTPKETLYLFKCLLAELPEAETAAAFRELS